MNQNGNAEQSTSKSKAQLNSEIHIGEYVLELRWYTGKTGPQHILSRVPTHNDIT